MKRLTQIFQALLGVTALILTTLVAAGRLAWRTIRNWWKNRITGKPLTPAIYSDINMLSEDIFEVQMHDSYDWYLLGTDGNEVIEQQPNLE